MREKEAIWLNLFIDSEWIFDDICLGQSNEMVPSQPSEITQLLKEIRQGSPSALEALLPLVYDELRRLASMYLQKEYQHRTIQTTELVHEAYLRLVGSDVSWENRAHFFGIAGRSMRQILVTQARKRQAEKRGGELTRISLAEGILITDKTDDKLLALEDALARLETFDEQMCRIVELRFFVGLSVRETAEAMSLPLATIKREWTVVKAWLQREVAA